MGNIVQVPFEAESPEIKSCVENYWTRRADSFYDLREAEIESNKYERWEQEILGQLPVGRSLKILDVGCGCGFFGIILTRQGHQVTGIDLTPAMIEKGKELAVEYDCSMELLVMDAEKLEFETGTFDVVISRNLTWTLPHPEKAYAEWLRVLKRGGMLLNYDAEYARDHHQKLPPNHAHDQMGKELNEECHKIYHMLTISSIDRPEWDVRYLERLGMEVLPVDPRVGERIYREQDQFYIPNPVFRIKGLK